MKDKFQTFLDGNCEIYVMDEDGNAAKKKGKMRFEDRTVGSKRYYEAMTAKVQIDRLIRVLFRPWITTEYLAVIDGEIYEIKRVQKIPTSPVSMDLSLQLSRQRRVTSGTISC